METLQKCALVLTIVGAVNWGLIGLFNVNLVTLLFKESMFTNLIYILVGVCGLVNIMILFMHLKKDPE